MKPVIALGFIAACFSCKSSANGPDCKKLADKIVAVARTELAKEESKARQAAEAQLPTVRSEIVERCEKDSGAFGKVADCIMSADTSAALEACDPKLDSPPSASKEEK